MRTLTNPKTNESIESVFDTHVEAAAALQLRLSASEWTGQAAEFPSSLVAFVARFGNCVSEGRAFWLHKLASEGRNKPQPQASGVFNLSGLRSLFEKAASRLKRPAIVLSTQAGEEVKVSVATDRSRYPGQIMVASPTYGGAYYGRVSQDGEFFAGRNVNDEIRSLLSELSTDAAACAAKHGHLTGKCCFCNRALTDEKSTTVGYGPVCATNFGLPWGVKVAR
jgi:hypothetical protein